tara:strand:+ start:891 stop:1949 length:1059 start_codon:yes stop_codon:yes gene_type:complete
MGLLITKQVAASTVPNSPTGTYTIFLDTDGIEKKKDENGVVTFTSGSDQNDKVKASATDTTEGFLDTKITGTTDKITISKINSGANEYFVITVGVDVFDKVSDDSDNITEGAVNLFLTSAERAKIGNSLTTITGSSHSQLTLDDGTNPHGTTKANVGLGAADNTSDATKPVSTATQTALDLKRDKTAIKNSIEDDSDSLQLVNDANNPGNNQYYGTNASGTKGFHTLPTASISYFKAEVISTTSSNNFNSNTPTNVPDLSFTITQDGDYVFYSVVNCNNDQNEELDMYFAKNGTTETDSLTIDRQQKNSDQSVQSTYPIDGLVIGDVITVQFNTRGDNVDLLTRRMLIQSWL